MIRCKKIGYTALNRESKCPRFGTIAFQEKEFEMASNPLDYPFPSHTTNSLSSTKMAMYRALCAITSFNCQLDVSNGYYLNGMAGMVFGLTAELLKNTPEQWDVLIPGRLKGIGGQYIYVGFFLSNRTEEPVDGTWKMVAYRAVVRVVVMWDEESVFTYDFDRFTHKPLFQFDELGSAR